MAKVKVAFKNVLDKRATYKYVEKEYLSAAALEYARLYCEDHDIYQLVVREKTHIRLNGKIVPVDDWALTPLRDGDKILITPVLEGDVLGGGGILGIVLGALLIVAAAFTGGATLTLLGIAFNQTLFLMGAAMVLGGLASMFMQPDLPTLTSGGLAGKGSTTYTWSGITTQARPDRPIPIIYGKHMVGGNLINIFTERQGEDDYLYMLIALGEGEIEGICTEDNTDNVCTTTDRTNAAYKHPAIKVEDQPFQNYKDIQWWYRNGTNLPNAAVSSTDPSAQNIIPHFNGSRMQMDDGRTITTDGVIYTTTKEVDMATVQVHFPSLFNANGGNVSSTTVHYGIQYRKNGDSTWNNVSETRIDPAVTPQQRPDGTWTPERGISTSLRFGSDIPGVRNGGTYALTDEVPDRFWLRVSQKRVSTTEQQGTEFDNYFQGYYRPQTIVTTYQYLTIKNLTTNEMWTKQIRKSSTVDYNIHDGLYGYINYSTSPTNRITQVKSIDLGDYTFKLPNRLKNGDTWIISATQSQEFWRTITDKTKTGLWNAVTLDFHTLAAGEGKQIYDIRVLRQEAISSDFNVSNGAILNSVIEIVNGDFIYPNTALLGFKIKATGQLSGSPPNITALIKGKKVLVPDHSGSESFEEIFWDEDDNRWEYDGAERTWDNSTYTEEYSNNAMLCLKDLMTNKVYGLGEYTNDNDFSDANIISIIKECHKEYTPTEEDYVKWWTVGNDAEFVKSIEDGMSTSFEKTFTISASSSTIAYSGAYSHWIPFRLDAPLKSGQRYRFSITLSGTSHNVDIDIATRKGDWKATANNSWYQIGDYTAPEISDAGDGTHTYDFTAPFNGIVGMIINIVKTGASLNISGNITDISLDSIQGTGSNRAWHYHTFNGVFDSKQAALSTLLEFTNAFRVWPSWYEGTFKFVMDKDETPIHTISLSNTVNFSQTWTPLSEIPYRIVGQFTDEDKNYDLTQMMAQSSDSTIPKSNEQTIGLKGITNRKRAEREIKFRLTKFTNSTHSINIKCGMDMIHATAGDVINVSNDLPQWGHGSRIASYNVASKYMYLTEPFNVTDATPADVMIKYQDINNSFQTATLNMTGVSDNDTLKRVELKSWPANPNINGPAAMGISTSYVKKFRLLSVTRSGEEEVEANAMEHIDTIYGSEPTLVVNQDYETKILDTKIGKPGIPKNVTFSTLLPTEGIGWDIHAEHADLRSQEIIVEFGEGLNSNTFDQVGAILQGQSAMRYINPQLQTGSYHTFRLYAKGITGRSTNIYQTVYLDKVTFNVEQITGLQIKGSDALSQTWDGLDVTIQWNPAGQDWYRSGMMDFYSVYIYHTSYDPTNPNTNLLRTAYPKKTEYRYTYDMNVEDNGVDSVRGTLIFVITANLVNGIESPRSRPFRVINAAPNTPQNFTSEVALRTVTFKWSPVTDTDFKTFRLRHHLKDSTGTPISAWSAWEDKTSNSFARAVNGTEIGIYGNRPRVFFEVKAVDIYNGSSAVASGNNVTENLGGEVNLGTGAVGSINLTSSSVITRKVAANAISALKINVATLSAIAANMGVLTAGIAKSNDGRLLVDFDSKFIKIFDAASTLRVQLGSIA